MLRAVGLTRSYVGLGLSIKMCRLKRELMTKINFVCLRSKWAAFVLPHEYSDVERSFAVNSSS